MSDGAPRDPELTRLLIAEMRRHLETLEQRPHDVERCRRSLHALKGSAGLAGEPELAAALQRLERRARESDPSAIRDAEALVREGADRLANGRSATGSAWPEPPADLAPGELDPLVRAQYAAEIGDRLAGIDDALASTGDEVEAAATAYRHVHTMKGAASAVGDEPMTWFCHGLEDRLRTAKTRETAVAALGELASFRAVLGGLLDDPQGALRLLRGAPGKAHVTVAPPTQKLGARSEESTPPSEHARALGVAAEDATIRVEAAAIDRLLDQLVRIGLARERMASRVERGREHARRMRRLRADLSEALRLIGPPRPWGAPAAALQRIQTTVAHLATIGDDIELGAADVRGGDVALKDSVADAKHELSAMRQTPLRRMFARLQTAVEAEARRSDREIAVRLQGADETVDRRIADLLLEPCLQIARNSIAHGIEPPMARLAAGKSPVGTITFSARKAGHRLVVVVEDDGAGVDVAAVRQRAIDVGAVAPALAEAADDNTLLALLLLPGFSTRETSDILAGRGIGLDIALGAVQRMGGALRLTSRHGEGFAARVEVPIESGVASVLWVTAGDLEYAVPATNALGVRRGDTASGAGGVPSPSLHSLDSLLETARVPHLAACLEARSNDPAPLTLDILLEGDDQPYSVGVDAVGRTEDVLVRPLGPLVATMGPYAGAVVRDDGSLRLAIDVHGLAPRARALGRVPEARTSAFP